MVVLRAARTWVLYAALLCALGCNLQATFLQSQADAVKESKAGTSHWDPELVEHALATSIVMNEGYLEIIPEYEPLLLSTILTTVGYANLWLGERQELAELAGDFEEAERLNRRAGLLYDRALLLAKRMLRLRDKGFDDALSGGVERFERWARENFYEREDAEVALIAGLAWIATMEASEDGLAAAADRPFAEILLKRSVAIDPTLEGGMGLMLLGTVECAVPEMLGGDPRKGKALLERSAAIANRENHSTLVALAERCAVALQDRGLFKRLLREVIEARDVGEYRLVNKFARYKAQRLLAQMDDLFF